MSDDFLSQVFELFFSKPSLSNSFQVNYSNLKSSIWIYFDKKIAEYSGTI
ncbi:14920_t:CDS:2 [Dentiscutata erythropus]|uniref:14920_t:CDS:1 n=1 Tax=Dentiscutata erythropus TaxID=1348616 RepID=A0A9N8VPK2_9GLOM|nr:14920_t:CDS:2 [Dentiscutata erythropus]